MLAMAQAAVTFCERTSCAGRRSVNNGPSCVFARDGVRWRGAAEAAGRVAGARWGRGGREMEAGPHLARRLLAANLQPRGGAHRHSATLSTSEPVMDGALAAPAVGAARAAARADRTPAGEVLLLVWCRGSGKQRARCCCPAVVPSRWLKLFPVAARRIDDAGHEKVLHG